MGFIKLKLFRGSLVLISFVHLETTSSGLISTCILIVSVAIGVTFNGLLIFIATIILLLGSLFSLYHYSATSII